MLRLLQSSDADLAIRSEVGAHPTLVPRILTEFLDVQLMFSGGEKRKSFQKRKRRKHTQIRTSAGLSFPRPSTTCRAMVNSKDVSLWIDYWHFHHSRYQAGIINDSDCLLDQKNGILVRINTEAWGFKYSWEKRIISWSEDRILRLIDCELGWPNKTKVAQCTTLVLWSLTSDLFWAIVPAFFFFFKFSVLFHDRF